MCIVCLFLAVPHLQVLLILVFLFAFELLFQHRKACLEVIFMKTDHAWLHDELKFCNWGKVLILQDVKSAAIWIKLLKKLHFNTLLWSYPTSFSSKTIEIEGKSWVVYETRMVKPLITKTSVFLKSTFGQNLSGDEITLFVPAFWELWKCCGIRLFLL